MNEEIPTITIDGNEYVLDQLSEEHRNVINHMQIADQEIARLQTMIAILTTGRQAYINQLGEDLKGSEEGFTPEIVS
ncbi:hypothetical protein CBE37_05700 [bacterium TMED277]|nr:MAG: hypothetical protein CBE37_05700 [bacterium TMED277]|tara:strand:+ start:1355 stop:1585 length:231 start_codon:yes stop_codon:yes gene_type:complete